MWPKWKVWSIKFTEHNSPRFNPVQSYLHHQLICLSNWNSNLKFFKTLYFFLNFIMKLFYFLIGTIVPCFLSSSNFIFVCKIIKYLPFYLTLSNRLIIFQTSLCCPYFTTFVQSVIFNKVFFSVTWSAKLFVVYTDISLI